MVYVGYALLFCILLRGNNAKHYKHGHAKIVGGKNITIEEAPYQALLSISKIGDGPHQHHQCGGSIISESFILTAAHCCYNATSIEARIGTSKSASGGTVYKSDYFMIHEKYNKKSKDYDVAFMKTLKKMELDGVTTKIVTLVEGGSFIPAGSPVTVSGWGRIIQDGPLSPTLKAAELVTVTNEDCQEKLDHIITTRQLCAGVDDGSQDTCTGDSGGPAVLSDSKIQVGIVSANHGCAVVGKPGIYVNVTELRQWINKHTGV